MTPKCKTANSTTLIIERQALDPPTQNGTENGSVHIAGGDHKGIVINKQAVAGIYINILMYSPSQLIYLINSSKISYLCSNKWRNTSCPALSTIQSIPGECTN